MIRAHVSLYPLRINIHPTHLVDTGRPAVYSDTATRDDDDTFSIKVKKKSHKNNTHTAFSAPTYPTCQRNIPTNNTAMFVPNTHGNKTMPRKFAMTEYARHGYAHTPDY